MPPTGAQIPQLGLQQYSPAPHTFAPQRASAAGASSARASSGAVASGPRGDSDASGVDSASGTGGALSASPCLLQPGAEASQPNAKTRGRAQVGRRGDMVGADHARARRDRQGFRPCRPAFSPHAERPHRAFTQPWSWPTTRNCRRTSRSCRLRDFGSRSSARASGCRRRCTRCRPSCPNTPTAFSCR